MTSRSVIGSATSIAFVRSDEGVEASMFGEEGSLSTIKRKIRKMKELVRVIETNNQTNYETKNSLRTHTEVAVTEKPEEKSF